MATITFTALENEFLQSTIMTLYQDDYYRSFEGDLLRSILDLLEPQVPIDFTEKQNRRLQYQMEKFLETAFPYPYPYYPTTFGQDTHQVSIIKSIQAKLIAEQTQ